MSPASASDAAPDPALDRLGINVIRGLSMDAPHAAKSGHQGTAMALAPLAHVLYTRVMNYDAANPDWADRDRFILSCGHASILQYSLLHLTGFGLTLDDLREFRQWGSATPGHPEVGHTAGVEVTTGPLGQGFANGVGMGLAEARLRAEFGSDVADHYTFVLCSDGDLAEGVSHEAASMAGHLGLGRLIYVYDLNHISIDGNTDLWLSDDPVGRFESYQWHVEDLGEVADDLDALEAGLRRAMAVTDKPSLLVLRSHIGAPSPDLTDDHAAHGYAFKDDEIAATKAVLGLPTDESFYVPDNVIEYYRAAGRRGAAKREAWQDRLDAASIDKDRYAASVAGTALDGWQDALPSWEVGESVATRNASKACLGALAPLVPGLVSGGADLTGNTGTALPDPTPLTKTSPTGNQLYFGVREHGMAAVMNGAALHGGIVPVGGTFLVFSDYARPAVRLSALCNAKVIYSFTHDSVGVGEDGPTHQPVEHVAALRSMPDLRVIRPADANETAAAWRLAIAGDGPTALILSRQNLPVLAGTAAGAVDHGGYVLVDAANPAVTLMGAGSEVQWCVAAAETLAADGIAARVVSLPSWDLFAAQSDAYRQSVIDPSIPSISIEAGVTMGWHQWADHAIGIDRFGASAPGATVMTELGISADALVAKTRAVLG